MSLEQNHKRFIHSMLVASGVFFLGSVFSSSASGGDNFLEDREEIEIRVMALKEAYREAERRSFDSREKVVVIERHGPYVVVSFLDRKPKFGGPSHYVYDPKKQKVIQVKFED